MPMRRREERKRRKQTTKGKKREMCSKRRGKESPKKWKNLSIPNRRHQTIQDAHKKIPSSAMVWVALLALVNTGQRIRRSLIWNLCTSGHFSVECSVRDIYAWVPLRDIKFLAENLDWRRDFTSVFDMAGLLQLRMCGHSCILKMKCCFLQYNKSYLLNCLGGLAFSVSLGWVVCRTCILVNGGNAGSSTAQTERIRGT